MTNFLIIPYAVVGLEDLSLSSKLLLSEIISLSKKEGFCFASNEYLAENIGFSKRAVAYSINELKKNSYITVDRKRYIRYIEINREKLIEKGIPTKIPDKLFSSKSAKPAHQSANFADTSANIADHSAKSAQYNNNYNNKYKNNYIYKKPKKRKSSYDLEELMKIE